MSIDLPYPKPKSTWEKHANDRKVLISANICKTEDGFIVEVREALGVPKHFREDVGLVLRQAVDRFEKRNKAEGKDGAG